MRIGIDARFISAKPTGIGRYSEQLLTHLAQMDDEDEYVVLAHSGVISRLDLGENFKVIAHDVNPISSRTIFRLHKLLEKEGITIFHSLFPLAPLLFKGQLILTVHDIQPFLLPYSGAEKDNIRRLFSSLFYQWIYPRILHKAGWLVAVSEATREYMIELFPNVKDKVVVIHSGIAREWFEDISDDEIRRVTESHALPERYILYNGGCRPSKNLKSMVQSFVSLVRERPDLQNIQFILAVHDDGYLGDVKKYIQQKGIDERIKIIIGAGIDELRVLYKKALLLAFVTKYEGFGFPVLQAQAAGTPVLASTSAALPEVSRNAALLVDADDTSEIKAGFLKLLTDQSLYQELVKRGGENVKKYSWNNTARQVIEMYKHLT